MDKTINCTHQVSDRYLFDDINAELEKLLAIILLEFHDKNHLSGDDSSRNIIQRDMVKRVINQVQSLRIRFVTK